MGYTIGIYNRAFQCLLRGRKSDISILFSALSAENLKMFITVINTVFLLQHPQISRDFDNFSFFFLLKLEKFIGDRSVRERGTLMIDSYRLFKMFLIRVSTDLHEVFIQKHFQLVKTIRLNTHIDIFEEKKFSNFFFGVGVKKSKKNSIQWCKIN